MLLSKLPPVIITPMVASQMLVRQETAPEGTSPSVMTSAPEAQSAAQTAEVIMSAAGLSSCPTTTLQRSRVAEE